jgi:hypothetical protein
MKTGVELIAEERQRQIEKEKFSIQHDAKVYTGGNENDLCFAAVSYALPENLKTEWQKKNVGHRSNFFPWTKTWWKPSPENRIRELTKAGALIAAEIDRINRLKQ